MANRIVDRSRTWYIFYTFMSRKETIIRTEEGINKKPNRSTSLAIFNETV